MERNRHLSITFVSFFYYNFWRQFYIYVCVCVFTIKQSVCDLSSLLLVEPFALCRLELIRTTKFCMRGMQIKGMPPFKGFWKLEGNLIVMFVPCYWDQILSSMSSILEHYGNFDYELMIMGPSCYFIYSRHWSTITKQVSGVNQGCKRTLCKHLTAYYGFFCIYSFIISQLIRHKIFISCF